MQKLTNAEVRRALLASIASGNGPRAACREVGVSRTSLHRYAVADGRFKQRMREAHAFRGRHPAEIEAFLDDLDRPPPHAALPPVQPSPVAEPTSVVIDAVVVREEPAPPPHPPPQSGRCKAAFYDRLWDRFEDTKNTPLILQVEATRALERHYLREDVLGPPATATRDRARGLTAEAKSETLYKIMGPPPADDKSVA